LRVTKTCDRRHHRHDGSAIDYTLLRLADVSSALVSAICPCSAIVLASLPL
jgi:hypothetical protein